MGGSVCEVGGVKVQYTGKAVVHSTGPEPWLELAIPRGYLEAVRRATEKGFAAVTLEPPKRPRSTGPKSQNNRAHGFMRQIANWTGNSFAAVEAACKLRALDEGYPVEKALGQWVAKSQADLTVEECAAFIATIERLAAEEGIPLRED